MKLDLCMKAVRTLSSTFIRGSILLFFSCLLLLVPIRAQAFQVDELPADNLIENPWFRSAQNPRDSGLDGWIDAGGNNKYWSSSQKESNPTPDQITAGVCGSQELYCGTAARLDPTKGQSGGIGIPGVDAYLYQIVQADRSDRKLIFFAYWVSHEIEIAEVSIYGGDSANGPWDLVWVPLHHTQDKLIRPPRGEGVEALWENTGDVETVLEEGYSYYKVEFHARLPEGNSTGFKITGVYFSTAETDKLPSENIIMTPDILPSANTIMTPTVSDQQGPPAEEESQEPDARATRMARRTQLAQSLLVPTMTVTAVPQTSPTPTTIVLRSPTIPSITETPGDVITGPGFSTVIFTGGLIVLLIFGGVFLTRIIFKR